MSSPTTRPETPIEADSLNNEPCSDTVDTSSEPPGSVFNFLEENGRTYHGYRPGSYPFPNDPTETERLDYQFEMLKYAFSNRNYFAPLQNPGTILDIGTGTGQWAIEIGDEFPGAEVQATDLSPIQPSAVPENVHFFIDDASEPDWAVPASHFDYIHTRILLGSFKDFKDVIERGFYYCKPGGWMESQEYRTTTFCDDGTMPQGWPFLEWIAYAVDAAKEAGRPLNYAHKLKRWYEEAGFVDVREEIFKLPMNSWAKDSHLKALGAMSETNWLAGLGAFSMVYYSRVLGWTKDEIEVYLINVRRSISDRSVHAYHKVYVVWGRKPLPEEEKEKRTRDVNENKDGGNNKDES